MVPMMMPGIEPPMDPTPDAQLAMSKRKGKAPSMLKSVALIISCSLAMIVNVSLPEETVLDGSDDA